MTSAQTSQSNGVFVDSSVLIAAAISVNGAARDLLLRGFRCDLLLYISDDVLTETERNLTRKAPEFLAAETPGWEGILKHGLYHQRNGFGVDESVMFGEHYFVKALSLALQELREPAGKGEPHT